MKNVSASGKKAAILSICCFSFLLIQYPHLVFANDEAPSDFIIFTEEFPPYNYLDGEIKGINADIVKQLCKMADLSCKFEINPWNRSYRKATITANSGLVSTARRSNREALFEWIGPLVSSDTCLYKLKSRSDIKITKKSDLLAYTLGLTKAAAYGEILENMGFDENKNLIHYPNDHAEISALARGRVELVLGSVNTLEYQLEDKAISLSDLEPVWHIQDPLLRGNHLAINKQTKPEIIKNLRASLDEMKKTKEFDEIKSRYLSPLDNVDANIPKELIACISFPKV